MINKDNKIFGIEEYQLIHELVYEYQAGSQEAAEKLIANFKTFINKYVALIKFGQYSLDHYSIRSFIKLFVDNPAERAKVNSYFAKGSSRSIADKTVTRIVGIFSNTTQEDIHQELISIFLTMCAKYKDTKPSFHHYIKRNFHYYAYRHFEKLSKDPVARAHTISKTLVNSGNSQAIAETEIGNMIKDESVDVQMEEVLNEVELHYNLKMSNTTVVNEKNVSIYDDAFLNTNWINGITCSDVFKCLSPFERKILVMWYIEGKTDTDIAEEFGVCRGTINKRRAIAKQKLEKEVTKSKHIKR